MTLLFPIMLNIENKHIVVIGGGTVANRKVLMLLPYTPKIEIISNSISDTLLNLVKDNVINWKKQDYKYGIIPDCFMVIAATNKKDINNFIATEAKAKNILVNIVDDLDNSEIIIPSIHNVGDLTISVSTNGKSPLLAKKIRNDLALKYDDNYSYLLNILSEIRTLALGTIEVEGERKKLFEKIINSNVFDLIKEKNFNEAQKLAYQIYETYFLQVNHRDNK